MEGFRVVVVVVVVVVLLGVVEVALVVVVVRCVVLGRVGGRVRTGFVVADDLVVVLGADRLKVVLIRLLDDGVVVTTAGLGTATGMTG